MKPVIAAIGAALALAPFSVAHAGQYADELTQCVSKATTPADQVVLVTWIFGAISAHPAFADYSKVTPDQRVELNKKAAAVIQRLITDDCRPQIIAALKHEGLDAFKASFSAVGRMAMENMMAEPKVQADFDDVGRYFDTAKLEAVGKEAAKDDPPGKGSK
jgi:hypothetical protein